MADVESSPIPWLESILNFIQRPEPAWLVTAMGNLQTAMIALAIKAGEAYLTMLMAQATAAVSNNSLTPAQQLQSVMSAATDPTNTVQPAQALETSEIQTLVSGLIGIATTAMANATSS